MRRNVRPVTDAPTRATASRESYRRSDAPSTTLCAEKNIGTGFVSHDSVHSELALRNTQSPSGPDAR